MSVKNETWYAIMTSEYFSLIMIIFDKCIVQLIFFSYIYNSYMKLTG